MTKILVTEELWAVVEPSLPEEPPEPKGGHPRCSDRDALRGIVFVLRSGIPWEMLPIEVFGCSGTTCWRRLRDWQRAGVWDRLHRALLERLAAADELDWSRASLDATPTAQTYGPPRCKPCLFEGLVSLLKRIRPFGTEPLAKMEHRASWSS